MSRRPPRRLSESEASPLALAGPKKRLEKRRFFPERAAPKLAIALLSIVVGVLSLPTESPPLQAGATESQAAPRSHRLVMAAKARAKSETSHVVRGQIIENEGGAIPFAQIHCEHDDGESTEHLSDALGQFEFESDSEEIELTVSAPGFMADDVSLRLPHEAITVELERSFELVGRVVREDDGAPVANARVGADLTQGPSDEESFVRTDSAGHFRIADLEAGHYTPHASAARLFGVGSSVTLSRGTEAQPVTIRVRQAQAARLRLELEDRSPCDDGMVTLESRMFGTFEGDTDSEGGVRFEGLPSSTYAVTVRCNEPRLQQIEDPLEVADHDIDRVFLLRRGLSIAGRVIDGGGHPREGVQVLVGLEREGDGDRPFKIASSEEDGRFVIHGLSPGSYELDLLTGAPPTRVVLTGETKPAEVVLVDDSVRLQGRIIDAEGRAIAAANLHAASANDENGLSWDTGTDGRFDVTHFGPGTFSITATLHGKRLPLVPDPTLVELPLKEDLTLVALAPKSEIEGAVRDSFGPRASVMIELWSESGAFEGFAQSDRLGRFQLYHVDCERGCTLRAESSRGETASAENVRPGHAVNLELKSAARLRGTVIGAPPSFTVSIQGRFWQLFHRTEGTFEIPDLPAGRHVVLIETEDAFSGLAVILAAGETRELRVSLSPGSSEDAENAQDDLYDIANSRLHTE